MVGPPTSSTMRPAGLAPNVLPQFVPLFRQLHDVRGRFTSSFQSQLAVAHKAAAAEVRHKMSDVLENKVEERASRREFPRRGSRHLANALRKRENSRGWPNPNYVFGFQAGLPQWLDSTLAAPYWYRLEEGELATGPVFVGRLVRRFGPVIRSFVPPRLARGAIRPHTARIENPIPAYKYMTEAGASEVARLTAGGMKQHYRNVGIRV